MKDEDGLTIKQAMFCQEYLVDFNATKAAVRAGYSEATAKVIACENLTKPYIKEKIDKLIKLREKRTEITADRVLVELSKIGFADIREIFTSSGALINASELPSDIAAAVNSIEVVTKMSEKDEEGNVIPEYTHKIKLNDKKGALELMGKHLGLYTDKVEHGISSDLKDFLSEIDGTSSGLPDGNKEGFE